MISNFPAASPFNPCKSISEMGIPITPTVQIRIEKCRVVKDRVYDHSDGPQSRWDSDSFSQTSESCRDYQECVRESCKFLNQEKWTHAWPLTVRLRTKSFTPPDFWTSKSLEAFFNSNIFTGKDITITELKSEFSHHSHYGYWYLPLVISFFSHYNPVQLNSFPLWCQIVDFNIT